MQDFFLQNTKIRAIKMLKTTPLPLTIVQCSIRGSFLTLRAEKLKKGKKFQKT